MADTDTQTVRDGAKAAAYVADAVGHILDLPGFSLDSTSTTIDVSGLPPDRKPAEGSCKSDSGRRVGKVVSRSQLRVALHDAQELLGLVARALEEDPGARKTAVARIGRIIR